MNSNADGIQIVKAETASLFDEHGRCIPGGLHAPVHHKVRRYFALARREYDYQDIYARLHKHLPLSGNISAEAFEQRARDVLQRLRDTPASAGIANGVCIPFMLPQAEYPDIGEALEQTYLKAVQASFEDKFPDYRFTDHHPHSLPGKLAIAANSRHERLLDAMRQGEVVGYYFPCLNEYSIPAAIEQLALLPEQFLLAGGYDTCAALIGAPDLLLRDDGYPPLLWLAALTEANKQAAHYFEAYGYNLTFNRRPHFDQAAEYWTSGLVVLG